MSEISNDVGKSPGRMLPLMAGGVLMSLLVGKLLRRKRHVRTERHDHGALVHDHDHVHVTHNRTDPGKGVGGWEHLTATHSHLHDHAPLEHSHRPHRNFLKEHRSEAHVHDHEEPVSES